ncbi:GtrA family protein [Pseudonocardia nantongensis]|uniref:GtrA family protein n=1 Tax=Pseudonocardia nantongensis TaxID=1181885 RepID=UPI00397AF75C
MNPASAPGPGERHGGHVPSWWHARYPTVRRLVRYATVGGAATALNAVLFLLLRYVLDTFPANLIALTLTTAVSTEANRRFAFDGARAHRLRGWVQDVGTVAFYACYTSVVLVTLHALITEPTPGQEAAAVAAASLAGGVLRYTVLRFWVFETGADAHPSGAQEGTARCSTTSHRST